MLTTREVINATGLHQRTLDTWVRRGHLWPPIKKKGRLYWNEAVVAVCLDRKEKSASRPKRTPDALAVAEKALKIAERQRDLALGWLVVKLLNGGALPLSDSVLRANVGTQRVEDVLAQFDVSLVEQTCLVVLRYPRKRAT